MKRFSSSPLLFYVLGLTALALLLQAGVNYLDMSALRSSEAEQSRSLLQKSNVHIYGDKGEIKYQLDSEELWYFADSEDIHFENTKILYHTQKEGLLEMVAKEGVMKEAERKIYLHGDVKVTRFNQNDSERTLRTSDIVIDLTKKVADSDAHAVIHDDKSRIEGKGIRINLASGEMTLKSQTKTTYVP